MGDYQYALLKIRHKPFSVYLKFLAPDGVRGQEAIYVEGQNDGRLWVHRGPLLGTLSLRPDSPAAMNRGRYPITEIGLVNLVRRLMDMGQETSSTASAK